MVDEYDPFIVYKGPKEVNAMLRFLETDGKEWEEGKQVKEHKVVAEHQAPEMPVPQSSGKDDL